jgi:voltage-gated potassium channel
MPAREATLFDDTSRLKRWEARTEIALSVAAVVFLFAYGLPIVWPGTPKVVRDWCQWIIIVTWVAFGIDYIIRLVIAERRWSFVKHNVIDLLALALPVLRPLRLLRLVLLLSVLGRVGSHTLRGRVATYAAGGTVLLVLTGALAITDAERGVPGAAIQNFGDGLWWACETITTVGFGDRVPVTDTGRVIAVALMIGGVALLGVVTAMLASWLVERMSTEAESSESVTREQIAALNDEVRRLRETIDRALERQENEERSRS